MSGVGNSSALTDVEVAMPTSDVSTMRHFPSHRIAGRVLVVLAVMVVAAASHAASHAAVRHFVTFGPPGPSRPARYTPR